jgi:hypothetical protein
MSLRARREAMDLPRPRDGITALAFQRHEFDPRRIGGRGRFTLTVDFDGSRAAIGMSASHISPPSVRRHQETVASLDRE